MAVCKVIPVCAIIHGMKKTIFIAGKKSLDGKKLAQAFSKSGRKVVCATQSSDIENQEGFVEWKPSSAVSARACVLEAENMAGGLSEAILFFDEDYFARQQGIMDAQECSLVADNLVVSWQYLALELLNRFEKLNKTSSKPGKLVFLLREGVGALDVAKNPANKNGLKAVSSPLVSSAKGSFVSFAEAIAAAFGDRESVNIILAKVESNADIGSTDDSLGTWLSEYLDSVDDLKNKLTAKKSINWVKAGAKGANSSMFGFFGGRK